MTAAEGRAQRLLRCYPRVWRDRYGDEFGALLVEDLTERPRCWRRNVDVIRAGLGAHLSACGITRGPIQDRSSRTTAAAAAWVCFAACAVSIWTQLANGWLTAESVKGPVTGTVTVSLVALSAGLVGLLASAGVLAMRMAVAVVQTWRAGAGRLLARPLLTFAASCAVLVVGLGVVAATSPSARGAHHAGVLAQAASIGWAATQTISTFWLHPSRLIALPATDIAWMVLCPAAVVAAGRSLARLTGVMSRAATRPGWHASSVANVLLPPCLTGAAIWVIGSQHAANLNYRAGTLDLFLIAVMAIASGVVRRAATATA